MSQTEDDDDEEGDDWFEDVQEKNLSCDPGAGLLPNNQYSEWEQDV